MKDPKENGDKTFSLLFVITDVNNRGDVRDVQKRPHGGVSIGTDSSFMFGIRSMCGEFNDTLFMPIYCIC